METLATLSTLTAVLPADDAEDETLYEVVDGKRVELAPMGAYDVRLATVLVTYIEMFARQHRLGRAVQEVLFNLNPAVPRKRRPDAAFVSYTHWPQRQPIPRTEAWDVIPDLVIEIVSPSDKGDNIIDKVAEYFRAGVTCVWQVFPSQELVYVYTALTQVQVLTRTDILHGEPVLPDFRLPLATLFDNGEEATAEL